jgi:hypothetical protein
MRFAELEEKGSSLIQYAKRCFSSRLPEVNVFRLQALQVVKPVGVRYTEVEFHKWNEELKGTIYDGRRKIPSQLIILLRITLSLFYGVFCSVECHFLANNLCHVKALAVGEEQGISKYVGEFLPELFCIYLVGIFPEKKLIDLGGFDREGQGQVFGIVKLRPVAGIAKSDDFCRQGLEVGRFSMRHNRRPLQAAES